VKKDGALELIGVRSDLPIATAGIEEGEIREFINSERPEIEGVSSVWSAEHIPPLDTSQVSRQMRLDPLPLLVAQPKQIPAHDPNPSPKKNQYRIVRLQELMSSDPSPSPS
jgi:hypothetical protein